MDIDQVRNTLNQLALQRIKLDKLPTLIKAEYKTKLDEIADEIEDKLSGIEQDTQSVDQQIASLVRDNRQALMPHSKSVKLAKVIIAYRDRPKKVKIIDKNTVMKIARKRGIVRKIGKLKLTWKVVHDKLVERLKQDHELAVELLENDAIDILPKGEDLYIKSSSGTITIQSQALSDPAIRIEQKTD